MKITLGSRKARQQRKNQSSPVGIICSIIPAIYYLA